MTDKIWIIVSNEHSAFWGPNHAGYTRILENAGRYTKEEADAICSTRNAGRPDADGVRPEVAVIAPEAIKPSTDKKLDVIYDFIDTSLNNHDYSFVNRVLLAVYDTVKTNSGVSLEEVLAFLTVTLPAKSHLSFRDDLLKASIQRWGDEDGLFHGL